MKRFLLLALLLASPALRPHAAFAGSISEPDENRRVREVAQQLRCAVCQNESVADSGSTLAANMREVIRDKIREGESNDQIKAYFVSKYGDYILMEPRKLGVNWLLWAFPFAALIIGGLVLAMRFGKRETAAAAEAPIDSEALIQALRSNETANKEKS